jgi:hypothetical protein
MSNLFTGTEEKEFFVWVDEHEPITKHNIEKAGYLFSIPESDDVFPFIPNPKETGFRSQFIGNIIWSYQTEYNVELTRKWKFKEYPSRFTALFLFETQDEAQKYAKNHLWHVSYRSLKKVKTQDHYKYSKHDLGWIDFLIEPSGQNSDLLRDATMEYWKGTSVTGHNFIRMGKPCIINSNYEILYDGIVRPVETIQKGINP